MECPGTIDLHYLLTYLSVVFLLLLRGKLQNGWLYYDTENNGVDEGTFREIRKSGMFTKHGYWKEGRDMKKEPTFRLG